MECQGIGSVRVRGESGCKVQSGYRVSQDAGFSQGVVSGYGVSHGVRGSVRVWGVSQGVRCQGVQGSVRAWRVSQGVGFSQGVGCQPVCVGFSQGIGY